MIRKFLTVFGKQSGKPASFSFLVGSGFFLAYLVFFIKPIFFDATTMQFLPYIPRLNPIGIDLQQMLSYSDSWFVGKNTPYIGANLYPPLATVLVTPLLYVKFFTAYKIITLLTLSSFCFSTYLLLFRTSSSEPVSPFFFFLFFCGLFSYGMQFELERGQFNLIAMAFCWSAIWIYHFRSHIRWLAYILLTVSIQLKLFPAIFLLFFVKDWRDWKGNLARFAGLGAVNFLALFILGPKIFFDFFNAVKSQALHPYIWIGNHSIRSFTAWLATGNQLNGNIQSLFQASLFAIVFAFILIPFLRVFRQNQPEIDPYFLLACTIGALVIPSVSHDYTLSILTIPALIVLSSRQAFLTPKISSWLLQVLIFIFSFAYSSTLYSYTNKPPIFDNNFPALLVLLLINGVFSLTEPESPSEDQKTIKLSRYADTIH